MGVPGQEKLWDKEEKGHKTYNDIRIFTDEQLHNYTEEELKNYKPKHDTTMLYELEKGPWPSFVSDIKREALHRHKLGQNDLMIPAEICDDLLGVVELSYKEGETHWKHGGIVGVLGYGGGIVGLVRHRDGVLHLLVGARHQVGVGQNGAFHRQERQGVGK